EPVEYWIGASAEPAIDRASRIADGWLAAPGLTSEQARAQLAFYRQRCAARGRAPRAIAPPPDIAVAESSPAAEAVARRIATRGPGNFKPEARVWVSVDDVIARFRIYAGMGFTDIIVRHVTNERAKVLGSLARLREVREALKDA